MFPCYSFIDDSLCFSEVQSAFLCMGGGNICSLLNVNKVFAMGSWKPGFNSLAPREINAGGRHENLSVIPAGREADMDPNNRLTSLMN